MFETDNKILADAINSSSVYLNEFGNIVSQCRDLLFSNSNFVVSYVWGQANKVAHNIARASYSHNNPYIFYNVAETL